MAHEKISKLKNPFSCVLILRVEKEFENSHSCAQALHFRVKNDKTTHNRRQKNEFDSTLTQNKSKSILDRSSRRSHREVRSSKDCLNKMGSAHSNHERDETERVLVAARPNLQRCDNTVITAKFTIFTFLPLVSGNRAVKMIRQPVLFQP